MTGALLLLRVSWRNLWRNPRSTLLTALALGMGLASMLISLGLLDGGHEQAIATGVRLGPGHVVIQPKGYRDSGSDELLLDAATASRIAGMVQTHGIQKALRGMSPRLLATGLLSSAANSTGVSLVGVNPRDEVEASLIPQRMVAGTYLNADAISDVVIGADLARRLEVRTGSRVVLVTQASRQPGDAPESTAREETKSTLLRVRGIFHTGLQAVDGRVIHLTLPALQALLGVAAGSVTQVTLLLEREGESPGVARELERQLRGAPVEVLTWRQSIPELARMFGLDRAFHYVMNGVILVMVGLAILNTILMRVLERRYEFGVCKALGLRPGQLAAMVVGESLILTAISLALGLGVGLSIHHHLATSGLDLRWVFRDLPPAFVLDPVLHSRLTEARILSSVGIVFAMATIISVYPALKAARTELPEALKVL